MVVRRRKDDLPPSCSLFRHLQWLPRQQQLPPSLPRTPGKGPSLLGVVFAPAPSSASPQCGPPSSPRASAGVAWPGRPVALTWLLLLEGSRGPGASAVRAGPPGHSHQGISCFASQLCAGYTPPLKPDPVPTAWLQSSCVLLSFTSISGLFHLPGSTLMLHFAAFLWKP